MQKKHLKQLILSAFFLALGIVLPFLTMQIKEIGDTLLPMHLPVLLCGAICGWKYGFAIGLILPPFRSLLFGMPPLYPNAVWMAVELSVYGLVFGLLCRRLGKKHIGLLYASLLSAMLAGRIAWGITKGILLGIGGKTFPVSAFIAGGFVDALPGILLQLVLIPFILKITEKLNKQGE